MHAGSLCVLIVSTVLQLLAEAVANLARARDSKWRWNKTTNTFSTNVSRARRQRQWRKLKSHLPAMAEPPPQPDLVVVGRNTPLQNLVSTTRNGRRPKTPMLKISGKTAEKVYTPQNSPPAEGPPSPPGEPCTGVLAPRTSDLPFTVLS